jgi:hypothetical protein
MTTAQFTTLLRRKTHRAASLIAVLTIAAAPRSAAAQQVNACYVPSVGAVYLIGLPGLLTACLPSHLPVTLGGGALADGSVTAVKLADGR